MSAADIADKGAIISWPAIDTLGTPPPAIKERFPDLLIEPPREFARTIQGVQPPVRIGWAVIRPKTGSTTAVLPPLTWERIRLIFLSFKYLFYNCANCATHFWKACRKYAFSGLHDVSS